MSETFDAGWLSLREPVDHRSRAVTVPPLLREWWTESGACDVLDLGCGTGSNLRYLAPRLPGRQRWTLVDHDPALLAHIHAPRTDVEVRPVRGDISEAGLAEAGRSHLVTASALLDLVSARWLGDLVEACAEAECAALFALTYDGAIDWSGAADPVDALVRDAVNQHQRRDKGIGPALGPTASATAEELFRRRGFSTHLAPSAWVLGPADSALARELVKGWEAAAAEQRPDRAHDFRLWAERRLRAVATGDFGLTVGHQDLLALPPTAGRERR